MKHLNLIVSGKVQRVGYRFSAMEAACRFSVNGFVRNAGSTDVYIEAEGSDENLERFVAWCRKGPLGGKVEKVDVLEAEMKNFTSFEILSRTEAI
ncbi:MAG: acylphosphatase [bacterium]